MITLKKELYNYARFTLWQKTINLSLLWFSIIAMMNQHISEKTPLLVLLLVGYLAAIIVAFML
jgi:hypothetical protein